MIRTKDFLLFVIVVVFLLTGISSTFVYQNYKKSDASHIEPEFSYTERSYSLTVNEKTDDRATNLARLREKIKDEHSLTKVPDLDQGIPDSTPVGGVTNRSVMKCGFFGEDQTLIDTWPQNGIIIKEVEGTRMVAMSVVTSTTTASTTKYGLAEKPMVYLPLAQIRNLVDSCVAGEVVGFTSSGSLILNSQADSLKGYSEKEMLGYALDGLPIFGLKTDTTTLDSCGGSNTPTGYRYYLRSDESFVIGCYAGTPAQFLK